MFRTQNNRHITNLGELQLLKEGCAGLAAAHVHKDPLAPLINASICKHSSQQVMSPETLGLLPLWLITHFCRHQPGVGHFAEVDSGGCLLLIV
jgi:hypothetical protein